MIYQVRFCHLESLPEYTKGSTIYRKSKIGRMGSTGISSAPHLHFDIIQDIVLEEYRMSDIPDRIHDLPALMREYHFFLDDELFKTPLEITSYFYDPTYGYTDENHIFHWNHHPAYDVVPKNRHETKDNYDIFWNRSKPGKVMDLGLNHGCGYYIIICYEG